VQFSVRAQQFSPSILSICLAMKACVSPSKVQFIAGDILFHLSCCWCGCSPLRVTLRPGCFFLVFVILSTHSEVQTSVGDKATKKTATPPEEDIKKQSSQQQTERAEERRVEIEHWVGDPTALNAICLHNTDLNPYPYYGLPMPKHFYLFSIFTLNKSCRCQTFN